MEQYNNLLDQIKYEAPVNFVAILNRYINNTLGFENAGNLQFIFMFKTGYARIIGLHHGK